MKEARHFLARTGFGGTLEEIRVLANVDRKAAVEQVLSKTLQTASTPAPSWIDTRPLHPRERKAMSPEKKKAFKQERREKGMQLKAWWFQEMIATSSPLTERMTLFWHNHFTSSLRKVKWAPLLYRQNLLFRHMAVGSFRDLLGAIAKDPAMILYLDTQTNNKSHPNENFARELFELFTLGEGHYTEQDIKEAARAFTGWKLNRRDGSFRIARRQHDVGTEDGTWEDRSIDRRRHLNHRTRSTIDGYSCRQKIMAGVYFGSPRSTRSRSARSSLSTKATIT